MNITIDSKLTAILFLMNEMSRIKNKLEAYIPARVEDKSNVRLIVDEIKNMYSLNFNEIKTEEEADAYDIALGKYLSKVLNDSQPIYNDDEVKLIEKAVNVDPSNFKDIDIKLERDNHFHEVLKGVNISSNGIYSWLKNPEYVQVFESNYNKNYLCTKTVRKTSGVKLIMLYHMNRDPNDIKERYEIPTLLFVPFSDFEDMLNNPVRLFLYLLDKYGIEITTEDGRKTHFLIEVNANEINWNVSKGTSYFYINGNREYDNVKKEMDNTFIFCYGINIDKYLYEFKNNMISSS